MEKWKYICIYDASKQAQLTKYSKYKFICILKNIFPKFWFQFNRLKSEEGEQCVRNDSLIGICNRCNVALVALAAASILGPIELTKAGTRLGGLCG